MIVLGLVLVVIAVVVVLAAVFGGNSAQTTLDLGVVDIDITALGVFLVGGATLLVFAAGLALIRVGTRRGLARRKELRDARRQVRQQEAGDGEQRSGGRSGGQSGPQGPGGDTPPPA